MGWNAKEVDFGPLYWHESNFWQHFAFGVPTHRQSSKHNAKDIDPSTQFLSYVSPISLIDPSPQR